MGQTLCYGIVPNFFKGGAVQINMKKIISVITAAAAAIVISAGVFADGSYSMNYDGYEIGSSSSGAPKAVLNYVKGSEQIVYGVDITWQSMKYIYKPGIWNTENHEYEAGIFKPEVEDRNPHIGSNYIFVTNHSNTEIYPALEEFSRGEGYENINVTAVTGTMNTNGDRFITEEITKLKSAKSTAYEKAPYLLFKVDLSGSMPLPENYGEDEFAVVGQLTLSIT